MGGADRADTRLGERRWMVASTRAPLEFACANLFVEQANPLGQAAQSLAKDPFARIAPDRHTQDRAPGGLNRARLAMACHDFGSQLLSCCRICCASLTIRCRWPVPRFDLRRFPGDGRPILWMRGAVVPADVT